MRIDELDEFQGVTPQLVAEWMTRNGWKQTKPNWWARGQDGLMFDQQTFDQQWFWLKGLADVYTDGNQLAMLRKINPRMRQGMPSHAAIKAHDENMMKEGNDSGRWIAVRKCDKNAEVTVVRFVFGLSCVKVWFDTAKGTSDIRHEEGQWSFWPCDHKGNKVRWPSMPALHGGSEML